MKNIVAGPVPWIQITLNWGDMSQRQHNGTRKVASCELFMQHVLATLQKNKPIRKRNHDMSLRQDPPCEHFKKPIPATCPFVWTAHEILSRDMSLQHVPSCEPTLTQQKYILCWAGGGVDGVARCLPPIRRFQVQSPASKSFHRKTTSGLIFADHSKKPYFWVRVSVRFRVKDVDGNRKWVW